MYQTKAQTQICIFVQKVNKQPKTSQKWLVFSCFLVEAAGKRGIKQLITVFADAPEGNKEKMERKSPEAIIFDYISEPSENPLG